MQNNNYVIPFGKYKGKEISEIYNSDSSYVDWLMNQDWFKQKYNNSYNLVINNFHAEKSDASPEHNRLQIKFMDSDFREKIIDKLLKNIKLKVFKNEKIIFNDFPDGSESCYPPRFEVCGFDVVFYYDLFFDFEKYNIKFYEDLTDAVQCRTCGFFAVEIKPSLGDDFPAVLRQIKKQRDLIERQLLNENEIDYSFQIKHILMTERINTTTVNYEDVIKFFETENIKVILFSDIE